MRRYFLITIITLAVLITVTAGVCWYLLHDEAFLKSRLSSYALKYTGRELTVKGPLQLGLGRVTTLEANDIHFANATWAAEPDMVVIGRLKIAIELPSLFDDQPVFPSFSLENCKVNLLRNDDGVANWDMLPKSEPTPDRGPTPPPKNLPLVVRDMQIENCELWLGGRDLDQPLDIKVTSLSMQTLENKRWQSKGSGKVNELELSLDGWIDPVSAIFLGGPLNHDMKFNIGKMTAQSSGSFADAANLSGANITTKLQGPDIGALLKEFKLPLFSEGPFDYQLRLNTKGEMTQIDLDGDLGSLDIKATGELDQLRDPRKGNIHFSVDGPDLGALVKVFGIDGLVEEPFSHETRAEVKGDAIHFRKATLTTASDHLELGGHFSKGKGFAGTDLDIHFDTREIGRWTKVVGQPELTIGPLTLDGKLSSDANGLFSIQSKTVQGETTLDAHGELGTLPDALHPDLEVSFQSPDASQIADIAGLKDFPAAPLDIKGQAGFKNKQITLGKVKVKLAGDVADIDGQVNLQDRYAGSRLNLDFDIRNAGNLGRLFGKDGLPEQPMKLSAEVKPEGEGLTFQVMDGNLGKIQIEFDGQIENLQKPLWIDANFDIYLPRLSDLSFILPDMKLPDAPFTAKGQVESTDRQIQLKKVNVNLAGNHANIDGHINPLARYAGSKLNFDLDIKNAGALGRLFGRDDFPDQPMKLTASVQPAGKGLAFQVSHGKLGEMALALDGHIADVEQPMVMDANFDIKLPRLSDFSFLLPDRDLPDAPFTASGRLHNEKSQTRLDTVQLTLGKMTASVDGRLLPDSRFELAIKAAGPDASVLDKLVGTSLPAHQYSLATSLNGRPSRFELKGLDLNLGRSQIDGDLKIGLGDIKSIKGKINSPHIDLSHWYPGDEPEEEPKPATQSEWMFDDTPVMELADSGLDIDLDLQVSTLDLGNTSIEDIELGFLLSHQLVELKPFTLKGRQGGHYNGEFSLDGTGGTPKLHIRAHGRDIRLGLAAVAGQDLSTYPPLDLEVALDGVGSTRREVASSLDGTLRVYLGSGQFAAAGLDLLFSDFLTQLFTRLNPFSKNSKYTHLDCAVMAADAVSGKVDVLPIIFNTTQLTILSHGSVDLDSEKIHLSFNTKARKGIGITAGVLINPLIKVGGRLTAPHVEVDPAGTLRSGGLAVATIGISVLAKTVTDRFFSSKDPCGDARKAIDKRDSASP